MNRDYSRTREVKTIKTTEYWPHFSLTIKPMFSDSASQKLRVQKWRWSSAVHHKLSQDRRNWWRFSPDTLAGDSPFFWNLKVTCSFGFCWLTAALFFILLRLGLYNITVRPIWSTATDPVASSSFLIASTSSSGQLPWIFSCSSKKYKH